MTSSQKRVVNAQSVLLLNKPNIPYPPKNRSRKRFLDKICSERVSGIEPPSLDWQPSVITIIRHPHLRLWDRKELNLRPSDYESPALTAELRSRIDPLTYKTILKFGVCTPVISLKDIAFLFKRISLCRGRELNSRHKDFQSFALPLSYLGTSFHKMRGLCAR